MDSTTLSPAQAQKSPPRQFPQSPKYVSRQISRETLAELVVEAIERRWISPTAGGKALVGIDDGRFSVARVERLICSGAVYPKQRRVQFLELLSKVGA